VAIAGDASALLQKGGCVACHSVDKKILGPAFKDVAAKYKGQKEAEETLIKKVKAGGSGVWGPMPMPPNAGKLTDDEFKTVVAWVLAQ
jgi:cytochrome c